MALAIGSRAGPVGARSKVMKLASRAGSLSDRVRGSQGLLSTVRKGASGFKAFNPRFADERFDRAQTAKQLGDQTGEANVPDLNGTTPLLMKWRCLSGRKDACGV